MSDIVSRIRASLRYRVMFGVDSEKEIFSDQVREAADEIERLRAIVARLPHTADGVPIVPGMEVFWMYPTARSNGAEFCSASGRVRYVKTALPTDYRSAFCSPIAAETDNGEPLLRDCYSTREAAEAAGGES